MINANAKDKKLTSPARNGGPYRKTDLFKRVFPAISVIIVQMLITSASLHVLSNMRAYVEAESLWSKQQKNAIYFLSLYADTRDEKYFRQYAAALDTPLGYMSARMAMEQAEPDVGAATRGFLRGGTNADDIPGMIWFFLYFQKLTYMDDAAESWRGTDAPLLELSAFGRAVHEDLASNASEPVVNSIKTRNLSAQRTADAVGDRVFRFPERRLARDQVVLDAGKYREHRHFDRLDHLACSQTSHTANAL